MTKNFDQYFGPGCVWAWPGDVREAEELITVAYCEKSSPNCFTEDFFDLCLNHELFDQYPEEEAYELKKAAVKERQELFKDARDWPLPYVIASAIYYRLSTKETILEINYGLVASFLSFDKPLFDMVLSKGWDKKYQNELREAFRVMLFIEVSGITENLFLWGSDDKKSWFSCKGSVRHIYPEDVLRCLDLLDIDQTLAYWAVDKVFKWHSLAPVWAVLSMIRTLSWMIIHEINSKKWKE